MPNSPENGHDQDGPQETQTEQPSGIHEVIDVPDRDLDPREMAVIMRKVSGCCNFMASLILRHYSINRRMYTSAAGNPVIQAIINCAAQADLATVHLEGAPPILAPGPGTGTGMRPVPMRRN